MHGIMGGSGLEVTSLAHEITVVITSWTEPILDYLLRKELPEDHIEARRIIQRATAYAVHEGELFKCSITGVFQHCISPDKGQQLLQEMITHWERMKNSGVERNMWRE